MAMNLLPYLSAKSLVAVHPERSEGTDFET
jgi:hypothetical protein